jgi:hypothetical protein
MNPAIDNKTRAVSFFEFHGMTLLVAEHQGKRYVEAKPLSDLIGLAWRATRQTIQADDNLILYGTKRLAPAVFNVFPDTSIRAEAVVGPSEGGDATENESSGGVLHILFERIQMFLSRVNTGQLRGKGNREAANYLLSLQIEWAQVLHKYEAGDVVSKKSRRDDAGLVANLMKTRSLAKPCESAAFDLMVRDAMAEMGYPAGIDPQQDLPLAS